jgi:UDP-GlcNAc:undecaprenyl-phosphate GlcNAc-1-phosphate transferase
MKQMLTELTINDHNALAIVFVTFIISALLTIVVKKVAAFVGAMDEPNERKVHTKPVPRMGGLAIFFAFAFGYMMFCKPTTQMISVLLGGFILILTGIVDDIKPVPARWKFLCQIIAASVMVIYGRLFFDEITILGLKFNFPTWVNMGLSIFFTVAIINAINLIDGLNGLSSGNAIIYFITITVIGFRIGKFGGLDIILSLLMIGSTFGFWVHNFPKGGIFIGDTGSMFLGYMISVVALIGYKVATITSIIIPIVILFVPIMDTILAMIRRIIHHKSIVDPDKEHIHHQLLKMTSSPVKTVLIIYVMNIMFSLVSIEFVTGEKQLAIALYICLLIAFLFLIMKTDILFDKKKKNNK